MSASSGYINPQHISAPTNLDDASQHFRNLHPATLASSAPVVDSSGLLHIPAFQLSHPVVAGLLDDFVTMTCTILYYTTVLQTWPNSEALDTLATSAINIILAAYSIHFTLVAERREFEFFSWLLPSYMVTNSWSTVAPNMLVLVANWVSYRIRLHLEEVLEIARTFMYGFNLADENPIGTNQRNFRMAALLSSYLHLHSTPSPNDQHRVSSPCPFPDTISNLCNLSPYSGFSLHT
jgi:hypothetical protein